MDITAQRSDWPRLLQPVASRRAPRPSLRRLCALSFSVLALSLLALPAAAQNRGRFTLGGQFVALFSNQVQAPSSGLGGIGGTCRCGFYGGGVSFTARMVKRLGLDASVNYLPDRGPAALNWGYRVLAIGPRLRLNLAGHSALYLGFRPAWGWQSGSGQQILQSPAGPVTSTASYTNHFWGFDIGGTVQDRITRRWLLRFSLGDLWVVGPRCNNCVSDAGASAVPAQNLQLTVGLAYRI